MGTRAARVEPRILTVQRIDLYEEIGGWGTSAQRFCEALRQCKGDIEIHVNSPGGDVFEGFAIANALKTYQGKKVCVVDGLCASAATFPAMACDEVHMHAQSMLMIHDPWSSAIGGADDLDAQAKLLRDLTDCMVKLYAAKTNKSDEDIRKMLSDETWLKPDDAKAMGFCDVVLEKAAKVDARAMARFMARFKHPPKGALGEPPKPTQPAPKPPQPPKRASKMADRKTLVSLLASGFALMFAKATEAAEHPDQELQAAAKQLLAEDCLPRVISIMQPLAQADGLEESEEMAQALSVYQTAKAITGVSEGVNGALEALKKNADSKVSVASASRDVAVDIEISKGIKALKLLPAEGDKWRAAIASGSRTVADLKAFIATALPAAPNASSEPVVGQNVESGDTPTTQPNAEVQAFMDQIDF